MGGRGSSATGAVNRNSFTNEGGGMWSLDTASGGGQILEGGGTTAKDVEVAQSLGLGDRDTFYEVSSWDSSYNTSPKQYARTLTEAKDLILSTIR